MTDHIAARPHAAASMHAALGILRANGLRISTARRLVLEALFASELPVSAEMIAGGLGGRLPALDLASVYRNLETLEAVGLVRHLHLGHGASRYVLTGLGDDGWATCEGCGRHERLARDKAAQLRAAVRGATGFEACFSHFPIVGLCRDCALAGEPVPA
jgi:Fur family transcriptional regulator, ferric uptake regulator